MRGAPVAERGECPAGPLCAAANGLVSHNTPRLGNCGLLIILHRLTPVLEETIPLFFGALLIAHSTSGYMSSRLQCSIPASYLCTQHTQRFTPNAQAPIRYPLSWFNSGRKRKSARAGPIGSGIRPGRGRGHALRNSDYNNENSLTRERLLCYCAFVLSSSLPQRAACVACGWYGRAS